MKLFGEGYSSSSSAIKKKLPSCIYVISIIKDQYILQINISTHLITQEELCGKNYKSITICKADNKLKRCYLIQVMHDSRKYLFHP